MTEPLTLERKFLDRYEKVVLRETFYTHYVERKGKNMTVVQDYMEANTSFEEVRSRYLSLGFMVVQSV